MLGKNRGKVRSTGKKSRKAIEDVPFPDLPVNALDVDGVLVSSSAAPSEVSQPVLPLAIPRKFGSDIASTRFPDAVEPGTVEVVLKCKMFLAFLYCHATHS